MGVETVETENNEIAAKGFENTDFVVCILVLRVSREILPVGYLKGRYKSESSLMNCEAAARLGNPDALFYPESHR